MLNKMKDLKLLLHRFIYNSDSLQVLIQDFQNEFDLFSIEYDETTKIIQMKIKKTTMKKIPRYNHTSSFYYSIINPIISNFFYNNIDIIRQNIIGFQSLHESDMEILRDERKIMLLYNIIVIGDNIINIQL